MEDNIGDNDVNRTKRSSIAMGSNVNDENSGNASPKLSKKNNEDPYSSMEFNPISNIPPEIMDTANESAKILAEGNIENMVTYKGNEGLFSSFNPLKYIIKTNDNKGLLPDDDEDIDEYFRNLNDSVCELPSLNFNDTTKLEVGTQIRIKKPDTTDGSVLPDIYVITNINEDGSIMVKSTIDGSQMSIKKENISNIVNLNPLSLHIDKNFLEKIINPNPNIPKIREYKDNFFTIIIKNIDSKKMNSDVGAHENELYIKKLHEKMNVLMNEIINSPNNTIPTTIGESINQIKELALTPVKNATDCYYIRNLDFVLDVLLPYLVFLGALNNNQKNILKDKLLNSYIFVCECLSVTVIAGIVEMGINKERWIFTILNIFFNNVTSLLRLILSSSPELINSIINYIIDYAITPALVIYLYTNMDTITFCAEQFVDKINGLLSLIICTINYIRNKNTTRSSSSIKSGNSGSSIISVDSEKTLITITTFPSLNKLNREYTEQINRALNSILPIEKSGSKSFKKEEEENPSSQGSSSTFSSYLSSPSSLQPLSPSPHRIEEGGKIKRSRMTKKYKRMTIRRSKRSKKMKGGKRTRSSKKRRVVRRRKHNTKKY